MIIMENLIELYHGKEPRVKTWDLWKGFGYSEHRMLKRVIADNVTDFEELGDIKIISSSSKAKGRPDESYCLNFEQFLLLVSLTKHSPNNKTIKTKVINELISGFKDATFFAIIEIIKSFDAEELECDKYVYVAKEQVSGRYKIGISKNPEQRIKQLNTGNPEQLILIHSYLATEQKYQSEVLAHSLFNQDRLKGEWFKSTINLELLPEWSSSNE